MIISCAKTNLPILGGPGWAGHPLSRAVLLRDGYPPAAGWYDGVGCIGGLDLQASVVLDEIRSGTACLVLKDRYRSDDTPAGLGYSRIETDPERTPGREFVAACVRIGGFTTYEGYVLARDGKVTPEIGAALSGSDIAKVKQVAEGLRQAVAKCLAQLAAPRSSRPAHEIEKLISPSIGLDVVPLDAGCERLRVLGGPGLKQGGIPVELKLDGGVPTSSSDDLAAELIGWFPPRKKASAVLTNDDEPVAAVALYEALELGVSVYVSWTQDDIGMFGSAQQAIESLGVMNEEAEDLVRDIDSLKSGLDVTVPLRRTVGRRL